MTYKKLTLEFFHDVVCGWCFNLSPRLRSLSDTFDIEIRHRTFVLQASSAEMVRRFGSMAWAKETILEHWRNCRSASDQPQAFNIEGMRRAAFDYPHGLPGALACKATERQEGQSGHWAMFDALQRAHISRARNVADYSVLAELADDIGLSRPVFMRDLSDAHTRSLVEADRSYAAQMQVTSVPTVIVVETGKRLVNGPLESLRTQIARCFGVAA